jgi:hypothetical protein
MGFKIRKGRKVVKPKCQEHYYPKYFEYFSKKWRNSGELAANMVYGYAIPPMSARIDESPFYLP